MKVSLAPALERFVTDKIKAGLYSSPNEVVGDALRRWKEAEEASEFDPEWLEGKIEEGLNSGSPIPVDERFWDDLRRDVHKKAGRHKKNASR